MLACRRRAMPARPGTLIVGYGWELPPVQNPLLDAADRLLFSKLLRLDRNFIPQPELAESFARSPDGLSYVLVLREGATWHDGHPVTADDVVFTVRTALLPTTPFPSKYLLRSGGQDVVVTAEGARRVRFVMPRPDPAFLAHLGASNGPRIAPRHLLEGQDLQRSPFNWHPVGSGPFRLRELLDGMRITFERNLTYFEGTPCLREIIYESMPDPEARLAAFHAGEIDVSQEDNLERARQYMRLPGIDVHIVTTAFVNQLALNQRDPLFSDRRVRRAIAHALDRPAMARAALGDEMFFEPSLIGPTHWAHHPSVPRYAYDPDRAQRLLDEAGWKRGSSGVRERSGVPFRFTTPLTIDLDRRYGTLIQQYLRAVGIEQILEPVVDYAVAVKRRASDRLQTAFHGCINYEPSELYSCWHSSQIPPTGQNLWRFANAEVDHLLERAGEELDHETRRGLYARVQERILEECPTIPLHVFVQGHIVRRRISGYPPPSGNYTGILHQAPWRICAA